MAGEHTPAFLFSQKPLSHSLIITDEACSLETASIYPDDDSFTAWLEAVATDHIEDDRVEWFRQFVVVKELIDNDVAVAMERIVSV